MQQNLPSEEALDYYRSWKKGFSIQAIVGMVNQAFLDGLGGDFVARGPSGVAEAGL